MDFDFDIDRGIKQVRQAAQALRKAARIQFPLPKTRPTSLEGAAQIRDACIAWMEHVHKRYGTLPNDLGATDPTYTTLPDGRTVETGSKARRPYRYRNADGSLLDPVGLLGLLVASVPDETKASGAIEHCEGGVDTASHLFLHLPDDLRCPLYDKGTNFFGHTGLFDHAGPRGWFSVPAQMLLYGGRRSAHEAPIPPPILEHWENSYHLLHGTMRLVRAAALKLNDWVIDRIEQDRSSRWTEKRTRPRDQRRDAKRATIYKIHDKHPHWPVTRIAKQAGVAHKTVTRALADRQQALRRQVEE